MKNASVRTLVTLGWLLPLQAGLVPATLFGALPSDERVIAIGDVHGDIHDFREILRTTGLIDEWNNWTGGSTVLVQTGDLVERGTAVREVLDLVMSLQQQAPATGGQVIAMLGNHEVNNLLGYLDYQSTPPDIYEKIFAGFTDDESNDRRKRALKQWSRWRTRFPQCGAQPKQEWEVDHPPGFVEYFEAISPQGPYGQWLRSLPTLARVGTTLFGHAGPSPWLAEQGIESVYGVNRAVTAEIEAFDATREYLIGEGIVLPFFTLNEIHCAVTEALFQNMQPAKVPQRYQRPLSEEKRQRLLEIRQSLPDVDHSLTLQADGPLWYRGFARFEDDERHTIENLLSHWQVDSIVVAHTPQKGHVTKRLDRIFLIDTGMAYSPKIGGQAAALEIRDSTTFRAIYGTGATLLANMSTFDRLTGDASAEAWRAEAVRHRWLDIDREALPFDRETDLREFLRTARIVTSEEITSGLNRPHKLLLEQYGIKAHAVFRHFEAEERNKRLASGEVIRFFSDSYRNEVAAYEIARLLGYDHVYPAVPREIEGQQGSVQLWVENAISERERLARDLHPPDIDAWLEQGEDMRVFDNLVGNFDRNQTNILVDPDWKVWLIDHTRSFGRERQIPDPQYLTSCSRDLWERIRELAATTVEERLGAVLAESEIEAFLARRDRVVEVLEARIAEVGEDTVLRSNVALKAAAGTMLAGSDALASEPPAVPVQ